MKKMYSVYLLSVAFNIFFIYPLTVNATTPVYTQACDWSGSYIYTSQSYDCGACCGQNGTSCANQNTTCLATCNAIVASCANTKSTCDNSCLSTYTSCYNHCSGKNKTTCQSSCATAKTTCNNSCTSSQTTCLASNYNFGSPVNTVAGYTACQNACNSAQATCNSNYSTACTTYCNNSLVADPTPPPPPSAIPPPSTTACATSTCCSGGWGGYTIDNFRGSNANPTQSTTSVVRNQNKTTNLSIDTTRGSLTSIINQSGTAYQQTTAQQNASFAQLMPDPGYFSGDKPSLFDFGRYKAAAQATGNYYSSWCSFQNAVITPEVTKFGIIYVDLQKGESCFTTSTIHTVTAGSLNVIGTFALGLNGFANSTEQRNFKIALDVPIHVNPVVGPVSGSNTLDYKDYQYFQSQVKAGVFNPTGAGNPYEFAWSSIIPAQGKSPFGVNLGANYAPFTADEDLPAIMYQDSIFDIEASINASGAIYTPGFVEVEHWVTYKNTSNYVDGAIIAGRGMLIGAIRADNGTCTGGTFISFNPKAIDSLGVFVPSMITKVSHTVE